MPTIVGILTAPNRNPNRAKNPIAISPAVCKFIEFNTNKNIEPIPAPTAVVISDFTVKMYSILVSPL